MKPLLLGMALLTPPAASAQFASSLATPSALTWPDVSLTRVPDVVLSKVQDRRLNVVVGRQVQPAEVARRYGVRAASVRTLAKDTRSTLLEVRLQSAQNTRAPLRPASVQAYRVRSGDTLAGIASRFGIKVVDLLGVNLDRRSLDNLHLGEVLNVPTRETGLLVRIKPGQSALSLISGYGADLVATARANGVMPTELRVGDELLLPGIQAHGFQEQLLARRAAERRAQQAFQKQQQYERFLSWRSDRERQKLEDQYKTQEQYEKYLAWKNSPERQRQIAALERQAQFEAAQVAARARARRAAEQAAQARRVAIATASLRSRAPEVAPVQSARGLNWPMRSFRLTSRFGERDIAFHQQVFHGGIDLAAPYGTPVYAATSGVVTQSGYGNYGLNVFTRSGNSTIVYGHLSRAAVYNGQSVTAGQVVGFVGCTGICTGPHLHFEVRLSGRAVNPLALLP